MQDEVTAKAQKKRIVVTGGTGYIGYALLREIRENHLHALTPIALARATSDTIRLQRLLDYPATHDTVLIGDLADVQSLLPCVRNADVVVHLAADVDFFPSDVSKLIRSNVEGTRNLLEACARHADAKRSPMRFVYVSSTEAIGRTDGASKADEKAALNPESQYGRSKVIAESVVREYKDRLETTIVRPSGVYGPGERFFFFEFMQMISTGLAIFAPSPMNGRVVFTHVDDVVDGLLVCATHPQAAGQTYNLCSDESESYRAITETLADGLRYPRPIIFLRPSVGEFLMRVIGPLMNMGKRRVFVYHPKTVRESVVHREYSNEKLRRLGFTPKYSMLAGIEQTLKHELETGGISRAVVPVALKRCIHFVSVITFTISRLVLGRRRLDDDGVRRDPST